MIDQKAAVPTPGVFAYFGYHLAFEARIRLVAEAGFSSTALWYGPEEGMVRRGNADTMAALARDAGLSVVYVHASYRGINGVWLPAADMERRSILARYVDGLDYCARHRIPVLVIHASSTDEPPPVTEEGLSFFADTAAAAATRGVVVAVENTRAPFHLDAILDTVDGLGLCFDSSHDRIYSRPPDRPLDLLRRWGRRLVVTHLSDNDGRFDRHWIPREGVVDFSGIMAEARRAGFMTPHVLEVVPRTRKEPPLDFLRRARAAAADLVEGPPE